MKQYSKPVVSVDNGLAEGVYAASGCLVGRIADEGYEGGMTSIVLQCIIHMRQKSIPIQHRQ